MTCFICSRSSCAIWMHSLEERNKYDEDQAAYYAELNKKELEQIIYRGEFNSWGEVICEFNGLGDFCDEETHQKICNLYPEPEVVLHAEYAEENFNGDALVVYYDKGKFYIVKGFYCSCCGIENQWFPEDYEPKDFFSTLDKMIDGTFEDDNFSTIEKNVLKLIKSRADKIVLPQCETINPMTIEQQKAETLRVFETILKHAERQEESMFENFLKNRTVKKSIETIRATLQLADAGDKQ